MSAPKVDVLKAMDAACEWRGEFMFDFTSAAEVKVARDAVAGLIDDAAVMAKWIVRRGQELRDHGCAECVPGGELVEAGWRCGYHTALARAGGAA